MFVAKLTGHGLGMLANRLVHGCDKGTEKGEQGVLSQFSFAAICGMISLHGQPGIMRECDDGDQF